MVASPVVGQAARIGPGAVALQPMIDAGATGPQQAGERGDGFSPGGLQDRESASEDARLRRLSQLLFEPASLRRCQAEVSHGAPRYPEDTGFSKSVNVHHAARLERHEVGSPAARVPGRLPAPGQRWARRSVLTHSPALPSFLDLWSVSTDRLSGLSVPSLSAILKAILARCLPRALDEDANHSL
jgi:hypothetical protein